MTNEQFTFWLKGYLDAIKKPDLDLIKKKMGEIYDQRYNYPYYHFPDFKDIPYTMPTLTFGGQSIITTTNGS